MSRLVQLSAALDSILAFAKPGEMFEKYSAHSRWEDPEASGIRRAVTKRKIPKGAVMIGGVPHLREVDALNRESLRPVKASDMLDASGYKAAKHRLLIKAAQPELEKKLVNASTEAGRLAIKRDHFAGIRKQVKQPPSETHREITNLRGSMASELRTTHKIIGGIRDEHERQGLPRPIGIPGSTGGHGVDRPLMISEHLPAAIQEAKGRLKVLTEANIQHRTKRAGQLEGALRKRISTGIQHAQMAEGRPPHEQKILNAKTHNAMEPFMRKVPPNRAEYGNVAGYIAKPGQRTSLKKIEKTRSLLDSLREGTGTYAHQKRVEDHLIKSGKIFEPIPVPAEARIPRDKSFPHLRKIGIGAGIAAAGATALLIKKASEKKKKSQPIEFASAWEHLRDFQGKNFGRNLAKAPTKVFKRGEIYTAVKTNLIGGSKLIQMPPKAKARVNMRIAAAKGDARGFRQLARDLGVRHTIKTERIRAAEELKGLRIAARAVGPMKTQLEGATSKIEQLTRKADARGARIIKIRGERVSPAQAFKNGQAYGETVGAQKEAMKSAGARAHFDSEIHRVASEKDATHAAEMKEVKGAQRKKIAIGTAAGAGAGSVAGYEAGKERKKKTSFSKKIDTIELDVAPLRQLRNKIESRPKTTAHDIAVGGIEGGLGVIATDRLIHKFVPAGSGLGRKIGIGIGVGAAATGLVGAAVGKVERKRRDNRPITFAAPVANRTAVTRDRYSKKIHVEDMTKSENNYVRSGLGGAAISALLRKRSGLALRPAAIAGAGAGLAIQAVVRNRTAKTKDQFGDRSYAAKRIDNAPGQAAILGAGAIGAAQVVGGTAKFRAGIKKAHDIISKRSVRFGVIELERRAKETIQAEKIWTGGKRAGRFIRDIKGVATGKPALDARGRPKTKEWEKPWVKNAVGIAILGASLKGVHSARKFVHGAAARDAARGVAPGGLAKLSEVIKSGALRRAAENKIPGVKNVSDFMRKTKTEVHDAASDPLGKIATKIEKAAIAPKRTMTTAQKGDIEIDPNPHVAPAFTKQSPTGAVTHAPAGSEAAKIAERRRQQAIRKKIIKTAQEGGELSAIDNLIELAYADRILNKTKKLTSVGARDLLSARIFLSGMVKSTKPLRPKGKIKIGDAVVVAAGLGTTPKFNKRAIDMANSALKNRFPKGRAVIKPSDLDEIKATAASRIFGKAKTKKIIGFSEIVNDWDVRDPRGRSARVYAPGSQRRTRRKKRFHEREDNKRLIHQAELGGAAILGTLLAGGNRNRATGPISTNAAVAAEQVIPRRPSALTELLKESRLRRLSSNLDQLLEFAA